ncbi:MAG: carboxylating nicotinate-nucleotide diphosphorylase [Elusimicrobiota bacterium]
MGINRDNLIKTVRTALDEDMPSGDITSEGISFRSLNAAGTITAKQDCILCGITVAETVFKEVSEDISVEIIKNDGASVISGDTVMIITGVPMKLLEAERTALNFLSHLSGIATLTAKFVNIVKEVNNGCKVLDTRKTVPGLRMLEKYAVRTGNGMNHRMNLSDYVLIKENHIALSDAGIQGTVESIRKSVPENTPVEVEVENMNEVEEAVSAGADIIMLDNFSIDDIQKAVEKIRGTGSTAKIEVSGGVSLDTIGIIASKGVDRISVGCLTNSAPAVDFSMSMRNA